MSVKSDRRNENILLNQSVQLFFREVPCGPRGVSTGYRAKTLKRFKTLTLQIKTIICVSRHRRSCDDQLSTVELISSYSDNLFISFRISGKKVKTV